MNLYNEIMYHKEVDHNAAHSKWGNQFLHLVSSLMMIGAVYCFFLRNNRTVFKNCHNFSDVKTEWTYLYRRKCIR